MADEGPKPPKAKPEKSPEVVAAEKALSQFMANNPGCSISFEKNTNSVVIENPWGADDLRLRVPMDDAAGMKDLNNLSLNPRFDAIYHLDQNMAEFVFGFLPPSDQLVKEYIDRKFAFHFDGQDYDCWFGTPTERLFRVAKFSDRLPADPSATRIVPQLGAFKDFQNLDKLPPRVKEWFAERVARSFFVKPTSEKPIADAALFARHLNFMMRYYDRATPQIIIRELEVAALKEEQKPLRVLEAEFPKALVMSPIDDIVLRLLDTARQSPPRFAFVYHYQILEYVSYYYLDEKIRRSVRRFLKDPAVVNCSDEKIAELIAIFSDSTHGDEVKMIRVIEEHCDPRLIWKEVEHHKAFFSAEQVFDGGFVLAPLIAADTNAASWNAMWMPKTFHALDKVRNALVHAREKRELRVIFPTSANNRKVRYLAPVMQRIAEQLALKS
jgi:hypothetical protein